MIMVADVAVSPNSFDSLASPAEAMLEEEQSPLSETLATRPSWMSRSLLYICVFFAVVGTIFACVGQVDEVTQASVVVTPQGRLKPVQSELEGIVTDLLVKEGDTVTAGQPLAAIDSHEVVTILAELHAAERTLTDADRELKELLPIKERQLRSRMEILRKQVDSHQRRHEALSEQMTKEELALELERKRHELEREKHDESIKQLEVELENTIGNSTLRVKEYQTTRRLASQGAATKSQLLIAQRKAEEAAAEVAKQRSKLKEGADVRRIHDVAFRAKINQHEMTLAQIREVVAQNAVSSQSAELDLRQIQDEAELVRLQAQRKRDAMAFAYAQARHQADLNLSGLSPDILEQFANGKMAETDRHLIRAPLDGVVGSIVVTDGETAQRGATLMTLIPKGATLVAEVQIPNREMGRVREDLPVRLKFDAFPYAQHGAISGRLTRLVGMAEDAASAKSTAKSNRLGAAGTSSYYRGYCMLDQAYFRVNGVCKPLLPGMTATAEIVTGRKRIITIMLKPLLEFQQGRKAKS